VKEIKVFENKDLAEDYLVRLFDKLSNEAIEEKGYFTIALSGGQTPLSFYEKLTKQKDILWDKIHIFFVDERMISDDDENSNIYQINKNLIKPLNINKKNLHYINKEIDTIDSAQEYELEIKSFMKQEMPSFDLIILGIGKDGHTASLFPNSQTLKEKEKLITLDQKNEESFDRLSFTFPLINHAKNIVFLAFLQNKASIIKRVLLDKDHRLPATLVKATDKLYFILDKKAAIFMDL